MPNRLSATLSELLAEHPHAEHVEIMDNGVWFLVDDVNALHCSNPACDVAGNLHLDAKVRWLPTEQRLLVIAYCPKCGEAFEF